MRMYGWDALAEMERVEASKKRNKGIFNKLTRRQPTYRQLDDQVDMELSTLSPRNLPNSKDGNFVKGMITPSTFSLYLSNKLFER